ncbi:MAG TPA: DUF998 domain-containing protein [Oscillospiraceae bacterium]|mgnify:CR=1 FL=1|nr:DUF998 domain-containing protein [Oscillospiraceae bacterium]HPS35812.1 DUF998 domain-containing protein [Oscillospiraceae bacterium]
MSKDRNKFKRLMCFTGVLSLVFYVLHDYIGGLNYPGYDRLSQVVSDLTAVSAPSYVIANGLTAVYGLFGSLCCTIVSLIVCENVVGNRLLRLGVYLFTVMSWISAIGFSLFPLSQPGPSAAAFRDIMHIYAVTFSSVLLTIASLILIMIGGIKARPLAKGLPLIAAVALACILIGTFGVGLVPHDYFGLVERFCAYSPAVFTAVLGLYGLRFLKASSRINYL